MKHTGRHGTHSVVLKDNDHLNPFMKSPWTRPLVKGAWPLSGSNFTIYNVILSGIHSFW